MTLQVIGSQFSRGGSGLTDGTLKASLVELQGLNVSHVAGANANTKIDIAALRTEDTILTALIEDDTTGVTSGDDKANITIQETHAASAFTFTGAPSNAQTCIVNDAVYTAKTAPVAARDFKIGANVTATALALTNSINAWETRNNRDPNVVAVAAVGVVTVTSVVDGVGSAVVATGTVTTLAEVNNATGTSTFTPVSSVATDTATVNGVVFTNRVAPTLDNEFTLKGTDALQGVELARAINAYENEYGTLGVTAAADAGTGVVTVSPKVKTGNIITLVDTNMSNASASGGGYLANGTATGGFKTSTATTSKHLTVFWFNKK